MKDISNIEGLQKELKRFGLLAKKSFGQNFLINNQVLQKIADSAEIKPNETVIEIGPGPGGLTQKLIQQAQKVIAVEMDPDMVALLKYNMENPLNLEIVKKNALHYIPEIKEYKITANIPYHITSPLLRHYLLEIENKPSKVVLMIQDEVAKKITDKKSLSLLAIQVKIFGEPKYLFKVPSEDFHPAPKIDSAVISIDAFDKPLVSLIELESFFKTIKLGFSQKRKKIMNSFLSSNRYSKTELENIFEKANIDPDRRPQTLSIPEWKELNKIISAADTN